MINITAGGLEFYGGFIGAFLAGTGLPAHQEGLVPPLPGHHHPVAHVRHGHGPHRLLPQRLLLGGALPAEIPWSVRFPYASPAYYREWDDRLVTLPAELVYVDSRGIASPLPRDWMDEYAKNPKAAGAGEIIRKAQSFSVTPAELRHKVDDPHHQTLAPHPAQLYASIDGLLLAILLNAWFYRRKRHGTVFPLLLMLYAFQRFIEEAIRIDNPHDTAFMTISQFVSVVLFLAGAAWLLALQRLPLRSPLAVPYVPPWATPAPATAGAKPTDTGKPSSARRK